MKLSEIAEKLGCRLEGDPQAEIHSVIGIDHAIPGQLTFIA
ncbi:MAG: UDP-3-O-(3-hydroxymyristoyl)glucosamine N-acyltransferase, partial [Acidobacteria bacterium]|nr:UDP-3-O-(3-hydroxymyristoyl)glucosamine N-acyltransferase [Acidobacteriota bacterium]